jgi:hypothetical protein
MRGSAIVPMALAPSSARVFASARTFRRSTFAGYTARSLGARWASEIFRLAGERPNVILKFAEGGVERYRESALPADKIGPLELYA